VELITLIVIVQLPLAGILAPASVTLFVVLVNDMDAPVQVVAGAGMVWRVRLAGSVCVKPDWVNTKPLLLLSVNVSVEAALGATLAGENAWVMTGAIGVTFISGGHAPALVAAEDGAVLVAPPEVKVKMVVSVFPSESVTVRVKVPWPLPLVVIFACAAFAPELIWTVPVGRVHAYEAIVAPHAAALPLAFNVVLPVVKPAGIATATMGLCASCTALKAFTMPAPHWPDPRQEHCCVVASRVGHTGRLPVLAGNGLAPNFIRAINCAGVKFALTARISAATPATMGEEKLVPRLTLV
jgi:hypothetical protein